MRSLNLAGNRDLAKRSWKARRILGRSWVALEADLLKKDFYYYSPLPKANCQDLLDH